MKSSRYAAATEKKDIGDAVNLHWFGAMLLNWAVLIFFMAAAALLDTLFFYVLAVFVIGTRQHAIAILAHDGAHRHASPIRWLNDGATCVLGFWPLGIGLDGYRKFHFAHHQHLGQEGDPELVHKRRFADKWRLETSPLQLFLTDLLGFAWREVVFAIVLMRPARAMDVIGPLSMIGAAVFLAVSNGLADLIIVWYLALYTSFWAVFRMRAYTEHVGTTGTYHLTEPAWWKKLLYLPANTWLHWEHHKWPGIPSWRLAHLSRKNAESEEAHDASIDSDIQQMAEPSVGTPATPQTQTERH